VQYYFIVGGASPPAALVYIPGIATEAT